jgi:hypothetical protein
MSGVRLACASAATDRSIALAAATAAEATQRRAERPCIQPFAEILAFIVISPMAERDPCFDWAWLVRVRLAIIYWGQQFCHHFAYGGEI